MDFSAEQASHPNWPPRGPNLTPPDFFLCRYVKDKIFHNPPNTMDEVKLRIMEPINVIKLQTLRKDFRNMQKRVSACLREQGGHFEHMI